MDLLDVGFSEVNFFEFLLQLSMGILCLCRVTPSTGTRQKGEGASATLGQKQETMLNDRTA